MADAFGPLLATLRRIFPTSQLEPVAKPELDAICREYPGVPEHYLAFLRDVGYGALVVLLRSPATKSLGVFGEPPPHSGVGPGPVEGVSVAPVVFRP